MVLGHFGLFGFCQIVVYGHFGPNDSILAYLVYYQKKNKKKEKRKKKEKSNIMTRE